MAEKNAENADQFVCQKCDFMCHKKSDWNRHISTRKHQIGDKVVTEVTAKSAEWECLNCQKIYKSRNGLWVHKKKCVTINVVTEEDEKDEDDEKYEKEEDDEKDENLEAKLASNVMNSIGNDQKIDVLMLLELLKQSQEFQKQMLEQQKQMMEFAANNNTTNNNINYNANNSNNTNNSFNLNLFLNDTCKGAMNMSEFVDSIKMQLTDLESFAEVGYANGVSNIFVKGLNALGIHLRPIHCSDLKRETLYIKDNDCWVKEAEDRAVLKNAIKRVAFKNIKQINEWIKENPGCTDPRTKKHDKYNMIVMNSMSGTTIQEQQDNIEKIVKNVTKAVTIDKSYIKALKH
jgi:hypothetical protein